MFSRSLIWLLASAVWLILEPKASQAYDTKNLVDADVNNQVKSILLKPQSKVLRYGHLEVANLVRHPCPCKEPSPESNSGACELRKTNGAYKLAGRTSSGGNLHQTPLRYANGKRSLRAAEPALVDSSSPAPVSSSLTEQLSATGGSPSLRPAPLEGNERFEPQRIPLRIPVRRYYRSSPSVTIINPSGYGAGWGNAGVGIGLQERVRFDDEADGVIGFGFGLGDPQEYLGLQLGVTFVDLSDPLRDGVVNLKLHRRISYDFSVALGVQGLVTWGDTDGGSSVYGAATRRFALKSDRSQPFSELYTSIGVGGGQFRSEFNINNNDESIGVFGSVAVRVLEPVNFITEWSGQDLTLGVSIVPFRNLPIVIVPALTDVTGEAGDGARFILGVGYSLSF